MFRSASPGTLASFRWYIENGSCGVSHAYTISTLSRNTATAIALHLTACLAAIYNPSTSAREQAEPEGRSSSTPPANW